MAERVEPDCANLVRRFVIPVDGLERVPGSSGLLTRRWSDESVVVNRHRVNLDQVLRSGQRFHTDERLARMAGA